VSSNKHVAISMVASALLVACASQSPAPSSSAALTSATAPTAVAVSPQKSATAASATAQATGAKSLDVPYGFKRVVMNGQERFCEVEDMTGSRTQKFKRCLTRAELQARQDSGENFIQQVQRSGGVQTYTCAPGAAVAGKMCP